MNIISKLAVIAILVIGHSIGFAAEKACSSKDSSCREFAKLAEAGQFEKLVARVDAKKGYSGEAKAIIGQAFLMLAGKDGNTPQQEEQFCMKALEYGATSAYMGLYFIHAGQNDEKAFGYLKQYVATNPKDAVPFVLLGEAEMTKKNYAASYAYLREAKKVARGASVNTDWLLFQASYLTGDYNTASAMLDSSFAQGKTVGDLKSLVSDPRFSDIGKHQQFRKFFPIINGTTTARLYAR
jgi:tetratricopeptide (TPR) repeat protein